MGLKIGLSPFYSLLLFCSFLVCSNLMGQKLTDSDPQLTGIGIQENPGARLPVDLSFVNEAGDSVTLDDLLDPSRPVIFTLVYYECPMLCTLVLNGLMDGLQDLNLKAGSDYRLITLSIDPRESWELARIKKQNYLPGLGQVPDSSWTFLTGSEQNIRAVADTIGFKYYYDREQQEYAHAAAVFILTGDGRLSRYLYGLEYRTVDLKLALLEASDGRIGSTIDRLILYCYGYDPDRGGYAVIAIKIMKLGGVLTLLILTLFLLFLWLKERHGKPALTQHTGSERK